MASGLFSPVADIVGRDLELDRVEHLRGSLLLSGEAGIGKTTLWRAGVESAKARGLRVLTAAPAEAERSLSYAVLGDLLASVGDHVLAGLPVVQRRALERVLLTS